MGKIVAIGGGEIGRPGFPVETTQIDEEIIRLSGKKNPKIVFIPTASSDSDIYIRTFNKHFGTDLGSSVDTLRLKKSPPETEEIRTRISEADIIYVGGGNTLMMLKLWRKLGVDEMLLRAYNEGKILSGISAGAICWFRYGSSDSRKFRNPDDYRLIRVSAMNLVPAAFCPHYDIEEKRKPSLKILMQKTPGVALAVENCCAIEIIDDAYRVLTSKDSPGAYKVYWKRGMYYEDRIEQKKEFSPLSDLLKK